MGDYDDGKTAGHLEAIDKNLGDIKQASLDHNESDVKEFKAINEKIDEVKDMAKDAASAAFYASQKINTQDGVNAKRHTENIDRMIRMESKIDAMNKDVTDLKSSVANMKGWAVGISFVVAFAATWFKDKITKGGI